MTIQRCFIFAIVFITPTPPYRRKLFCIFSLLAEAEFLRCVSFQAYSRESRIRTCTALTLVHSRHLFMPRYSLHTAALPIAPSLQNHVLVTSICISLWQALSCISLCHLYPESVPSPCSVFTSPFSLCLIT